MKHLAIILALAALPGCASHEYLEASYDAAPRSVVQTSRDRFSVWDNPATKRVLVRPYDGTASTNTNLAFSSYPEPYFREAAELALSRRGCRVEGGEKILEQSFEYAYNCGQGST